MHAPPSKGGVKLQSFEVAEALDKIHHAIRGSITSPNWHSEEEANVQQAHLVVGSSMEEAPHEPPQGDCHALVTCCSRETSKL